MKGREIMQGQNEEVTRDGVSIIACTNKLGMMDNIFENYHNQEWEEKELIIILNNNSLKLEVWQNRAQASVNVSVYQLPEETTLGACLNFGVAHAKYTFVAKFDDDDYYGPFYLTEAMEAFTSTNADIVGKRTAFMYLKRQQQLRLRFPRNEKRWVRVVLGGTIIAKKAVFKRVKFPDRSLGEDTYFLTWSRMMGFRIFSTSRYNYAYLRRGDGTHNWKPTKSYLMRSSIKLFRTSQFKKYINKR